MSPDSISFDQNGLSAAADSSSPSPASLQTTSGETIAIHQLRSDYAENEVRADQIYKGRRFLFNGTVVEVSSVYYKTTGQDATGRYIYTNIGPNLKVSDAGAVIGWEVPCFFKDNTQLGQLRGQQRVIFEATVQGRERGGTNLILTDAVLR